MRFLAPLRQAYKVTRLTYPGRNFLNYVPAAVSWDQTYTRCHGSKSSGKYKHGSTFKRRFSRSSSNITPVAVITNADHSQKVALIPINLFESKRNDEEAFEEALAIVSLLRDHGRQVELFADNCTKLKSGDRRLQTFDKIMPQPSGKTQILTELEGHDEATFLTKQDNSLEEAVTDYIQNIPTVSFTTENDDLPAKIASQLREIPVSGMQLNFEMDMTNVKDALLNPGNLPALPSKPRNLENSTLALSTNVRLDSADTKTVPLHFNALIQGIVEVNPKEFSNDKLTTLKVPQFNEYVTAIAANLCSTALQRGFPTDVSRKFYSTNKTPSDNDVTVKNMLERYDQFRNERNARKAQMSTKSNDGKRFNKCHQGNDEVEIYSKFTSAPGLLDCNLYQKSLEVAARKRKEAPGSSSAQLTPKSQKRVTPPKGESGPEKVLTKSHSTDGPSSIEPKSTSHEAKTVSNPTGSATVSGFDSKGTCKNTSAPLITDSKNEANNPSKKSSSGSRSSSKSRSSGPCKKSPSASISGSRQEASGRCKKASSDSVKKSPCRPCREASLASKSSPRSTENRTLKKASALKPQGENPCKNASASSVTGSKSEGTRPCKTTSSASKSEATSPCKKASASKSQGESPCKKASALKSQGKSPCKKASSASISGPKSEGTSPCKTTSSASKSEATSPCKKASAPKSRGESPCKKASAVKSQGKSPCKKASSASISGPKSEGTSPCKTTSSASKSEATSPCKKASAPKSRGESPCNKASASKSQAKSPCKKASSASISGPKSEGTSPCKTTSSASKSEATSPCKKASAPKSRGESPCKKASAVKSQGKGPCKKASSASISGPKSEGTSPCKTTSSASKSEAISPCKKASAPKSRGESPCNKASASKSQAKSPSKKASSASISGSKSEGTSPCKNTSASNSKASSPCNKASPSKFRGESPCKKSSSTSIPGTKPTLNSPCKKASKTDACKKTSSASSCGSRSKTSQDSKSTKSQLKCGRPLVGDTSPKCKKASPISKCGSVKSGLKDPCKTSSSASKCGFKQDPPSASPDSRKACKRAAKAKCGSLKNLAKDASSSTGTLQAKAKCTKPKCSNYRCPSCSTTRDVHTLTTLLAPFAVNINPSSRNYSRKCPYDPKNINKPDSSKSDEYRSKTCEKISWKNTKHRKEHRNKPKNCYPEETQEFCPDTACYKASKYSKKGNKKPKENEIGNYKVLCSAAKYNIALLMSAGQRCHQSTNARINQEAIIEAPYKIGMRSHSIPRLFDNDILVAVDSVALSDSDIYMFETGAKHYQEVTLGNEAAGVVQKIGRNVQHVKIGDHVAIESAIPCRRCDLCKKGHYNLCNWMTFNGCLSKYCIHPGAFCYKISKEMPMERAAMAYQLALGCNVSHQAKIKPNSNVAIIGSCAMTVCAAICAQSMGASNICVMCGSASTGNVIEKFVTEKVGCFDGNVNESALVEKILDSLGTLPDIVVNCASCTKTMNAAIMALKPTGTCVIAGFHSECASFNIMDALMKEIRIIPSYRSKNMFPLAINLLESGRAPIDGLIANCCRWDELEAAFRVALSEGNSGPRKVVVQCQLGDGKIKTG